MPFTLATWNINSVRLRETLVSRLLTEEAPDILCLQECKAPVEKMPLEAFRALGYPHMVARGQKGYNGVAILSKLPILDAGDVDFAGHGPCAPCRGAAGERRDDPQLLRARGRRRAGPEVNEKFGQKLDYLTDMREHFRWNRPERAILVGDLNIAPREDDVWNHKQLLKIVSHTPVEVEHLGDAREAGRWVDVTRAGHPRGAALQLVVLPRGRLGRGRQGPAGWTTSGPRPTSRAPRTAAASCATAAAGSSRPTTRRSSPASTSDGDLEPARGSRI